MTRLDVLEQFVHVAEPTFGVLQAEGPGLEDWNLFAGLQHKRHSAQSTGCAPIRPRIVNAGVRDSGYRKASPCDRQSPTHDECTVRNPEIREQPHESNAQQAKTPHPGGDSAICECDACNQQADDCQWAIEAQENRCKAAPWPLRPCPWLGTVMLSPPTVWSVRVHDPNNIDDGQAPRSAALLGLGRGSIEHRRRVVVSRYDTRHVDIYRSARKHGVADAGKVLYLGADRAGNMLEVIAIERDDGTEIVIHAMRMRRLYEPLLREMGGTND
jgi:hypothetical protein